MVTCYKGDVPLPSAHTLVAEALRTFWCGGLFFSIWEITMYDEFFAFARERHEIYLRRKAGSASPWTDDPILHRYRFTNVYRELDNVTLWFAANARNRYEGDNVATLMATVVFRLFNRNITGEAIFNQTSFGNRTAFEEFLHTGDSGVMKPSILSFCGRGPYCTGAYIINSPNGMDKLTGVLQMIQWVWDGRADVFRAIEQAGTLEATWSAFTKFPHIADFTSYEFVTDLRWTDLLYNAPDILTWANPGPGAMRGLNRIFGRNLTSKQKKHLFIDEMRAIMAASRDPRNWPIDWPILEMREVEHTLCEFDKYLRVKTGQGKPRGIYRHG